MYTPGTLSRAWCTKVVPALGAPRMKRFGVRGSPAAAAAERRALVGSGISWATVLCGPEGSPGGGAALPSPLVAGAIFVVAGSSSGQQGPVASLVSTAGWAAAAERVLGEAWICTPTGIVGPGEARRRGSDPSLRSPGHPRLRRRVPAPVKTAMKDLRSWRRARSFDIDPAGPWVPDEVRFVWQRHELFHDAGLRLARALGVPSVLFVPATAVWEADRWGSPRPGWGRWLERVGERPALQGADLVACGSDEVAAQVHRLGVPEGRTVRTPSGVDLDLFMQPQDREGVRRELGLGEDFVVGWVGSFRRFHALEQAVEAAALVPGVRLLLVGDGPERPRVEQLARDRGVPATFTGTVSHEQLPAVLSGMDVALVLAAADQPFHYSPLKLAEYLAAGLPVVAPAVGQLRDRLTDGVDVRLVPAEDPHELAAALDALRTDPVQRARMAVAAREVAAREWSWDHQVRRVLDALAL